MSQLTIDLLIRNNNKPNKFELKNKRLKPCPFCGGDDICVIENKDNDFNMSWLRCVSCGVEGPFRDTRYHAIQMWQKRPIT